MSTWLQQAEPLDEDNNPDRWMVSYADFVTLLMAFFVVMYSVSQVNESKYKALSATFIDAFNLSDTMAAENASATQTLDELASTLSAETQSEASSQLVDTATDGSATLENNGAGQHSGVGSAEEAMQVNVAGNEQWLQIELPSEVLFPSGGATLSPSAKTVLDDIAAVFSTHDNAIRVEGFTDNQPIATPQFASNWALSSARATAVVQFLVESGIAPQRLAAIGYGEYQPVANNDTPEGRSRNRRIVLMVSPSQQLRPQASPWERSSPDASTGLAQSNTASQVPLNVERAAPTGVDERQPRQKEIAERQNAGFTFDSERSEPQNRPADATFDPGDWVKGVNTSAREQAERWLQEYGQPLPVSQQVPRPISLEQIEAESTP